MPALAAVMAQNSSSASSLSSTTKPLIASSSAVLSSSPATAAAAAAAVKSSQQSKRRSKGLRVRAALTTSSRVGLVVSHRPATVKAATCTLARARFVARQCGSAEAALELLRAHPSISVVLIDLEVPDCAVLAGTAAAVSSSSTLASSVAPLGSSLYLDGSSGRALSESSSASSSLSVYPAFALEPLAERENSDASSVQNSPLLPPARRLASAVAAGASAGASSASAAANTGGASTGTMGGSYTIAINSSSSTLGLGSSGAGSYHDGAGGDASPKLHSSVTNVMSLSSRTRDSPSQRSARATVATRAWPLADSELDSRSPRDRTGSFPSMPLHPSFTALSGLSSGSGILGALTASNTAVVGTAAAGSLPAHSSTSSPSSAAGAVTGKAQSLSPKGSNQGMASPPAGMLSHGMKLFGLDTGHVMADSLSAPSGAGAGAGDDGDASSPSWADQVLVELHARGAVVLLLPPASALFNSRCSEWVIRGRHVTSRVQTASVVRQLWKLDATVRQLLPPVVHGISPVTAAGVVSGGGGSGAPSSFDTLVSTSVGVQSSSSAAAAAAAALTGLSSSIQQNRPASPSQMLASQPFSSQASVAVLNVAAASIASGTPPDGDLTRSTSPLFSQQGGYVLEYYVSTVTECTTTSCDGDVVSQDLLLSCTPGLLAGRAPHSRRR